jgi:RNA polymerase sigma-70 factor (ECF subfamily)
VGSQFPSDVGEIYDRYAHQIYRYIYHRLGSRHLAEDLTGEVFVRFIRAGVKPEKNIAYLYRCAHNLIVDHLRRNPDLAESLDERLAAHHSDPAWITEIEAERFRLRRAISRLTPEQQQVIVLKYVEGFSNAEVGLILGKPEGSVKALQHRALARMRILLGEGSQCNVRLEFAGLLDR